MSEVKERAWVQLHALIPRAMSTKANRNAKAAGMSLSGFIAALIDSREVVTAIDDIRPELREINSWFGRLNSNINMIARHANIYRQGANSDLILMRLNELREDVRLITQKAASLQPKRGRPIKHD